ncbi:hypothetical protein WJ97_11420 [Burkholderia ubonensis]|uniref:hypothetical protein n=1 Tax=Burkholderia ubonensis TaxID=101571 RepID=UPI0007537CF0|nr:hypothetical protein [Burkholderia ubonensis]KVP96492.1 hypothetical protein WJ97_11420 [Burkholderia ubonensis]
MSQETKNSPQWMNVSNAMEALHQTLKHHDLFETHPDIAHDYVVLQEAMAVLEGDELVIRYWRARMAVILSKHPNPKARQAAPNRSGVSCSVRRSYLRQETKSA